MYGTAMGDLYVDVYDGTWHLAVWSRSGQQHTSSSDPWSQAIVDLSDYGNTSGVKLRFRGITGSSYTSDMAIDHINLHAVGDEDGDGIPDAWEITYFGHPSNCVATVDWDFDGHNNLQEYICGMDPTNAASTFIVTSSRPVVDYFIIEWVSVSGRVYSALWSMNLTNSFQPLESGIEYPRNSYTDTVHGAEEKCFYEVEVQLK
jgi:hypothetical protein